jgi:hypothetical protein
MMKWVYENQVKLLEKMEKIMADIGKTQKELGPIKTSINNFSEDFNCWISGRKLSSAADEADSSDTSSEAPCHFVEGRIMPE